MSQRSAGGVAGAGAHDHIVDRGVVGPPLEARLRRAKRSLCRAQVRTGPRVAAASVLRAWLFSPTQARLRLLDEAGVPCGPIIRRIQAEVYGLPVVRVNREEGPAYGAALLAAVGVGAFADVATACRATLKRLPPERPRPEAHRAYDE